MLSPLTCPNLLKPLPILAVTIETVTIIMSVTVDAQPQSRKMMAAEQVNREAEMKDLASEQWQRKVASWTLEERAAKEKKFLRKIDLHLLPILVSRLKILRQFEH